MYVTINLINEDKIEGIFEQYSAQITGLDILLTNIEQLPESIRRLKNLRILYIWGNCKLEYIPDCIGYLYNLDTLNILDNKNLENLPDSIGNLKNLTTLDIWGNPNLKNIHDSILNHPALNYRE